MISYIGGKSKIAPTLIIPNIPKDIETYVESFSGQFWVFFKMKAWLRKEGLAHFIFDIKFNNTFRRKHNWILITLRQINFQDIPLGFYL